MDDTKAIEARRRTFPVCCDIYQSDGSVILNMEMPGVTRENLDIKVNGDLLIVDGRKNTPRLKGTYLLREIKDGDYHHEFTIDKTIDRDRIEANIRNGIVTVTLGLKDSVKPRKIEVKAQ